MKIDVWSDVVCPWCYIGKRHLEVAIDRFEHASDVEVVWHSFQLDPNAPMRSDLDLATGIARKYGVSLAEAQAMNDRVTEVAAAAGITFELSKARPGNTFDAHRLLHFAADRGLGGALKEAFLAAYFTGGVAVSDHEALARVAVSVGLDEHEVREVLAGDAYDDAVRADRDVATDLGVTGVPFFVFDGKFAVPGAQSSDVLLATLERAWRKAHPLEVVVPPAGSADSGMCDDESCAI